MSSQISAIESCQLLSNAWEQYHERCAAMRQRIEASPQFQNPANRAKAYHSLLEAQAMAYSLAIAPRTNPPLLSTRFWYANMYTLGGNSADFYYGTVFLDGSRTYKITGNYGDLKLIVAQGYSQLLGDPASSMLGNFEFNDFALNPDGSFEVIISAEKHDGNWIPLDISSRNNFFFFRRAVADWKDNLGDMQINLVDDFARHNQPEEKPYDETDPVLQANRIIQAANLMEYLVTQWNIGIYQLYLKINGGEKNKITLLPGADIAKEFMGSPSTNYLFGIYDIKEDEALIIEMDVPQAGYWSFQLFDVWCKPIDFVNHQSDINMSRAAIDSDGKYRAVISAMDTGAANWLDPDGRLEGTMVGRNYLSTSIPAKPVVTRVKASEVFDHLPADTRKVTAQQRKAALDYRRTAYLKMYKEIN